MKKLCRFCYYMQELNDDKGSLRCIKHLCQGDKTAIKCQFFRNWLQPPEKTVKCFMVRMIKNWEDHGVIFKKGGIILVKDNGYRDCESDFYYYETYCIARDHCKKIKL